MIAQQILQLFFLHLLLVGNWLKNALVVLWSAQINQLRSIYPTCMHRLILRLPMVPPCNWALLGTSYALGYY